MTSEHIVELEQQYQLPTYPKLPIAIARGEGSYVWDTDGNRYLDFYGGHCVTPLGHCPSVVVDAVKQQLDQLIFYSNVAHNPMRADAARTLVEAAPNGLSHVFFANSGTEANETALKVVRKASGKPGLVAMEGAFHGRTLGSLAATWNPKYRNPYRSVLPDTTFIPFGDAEAVAHTFNQRENIGALILEPIQSIAGIRTAPEAYYQDLRELCDAHDVALIFDEVQTGVGRTGTFSIAEQFGITPDVVTMAKSLGSGVPVSAVLTTPELADTVEHSDQGCTFGGGMLAMAALRATVSTITSEGLMDRAQSIYDQIEEGVADQVEEIRGRGCLIGLELADAAKPIITHLRDNGVLVGSAAPDNVLRVMPPLNATDEEVDEFVTTINGVLG